VRKLARLLLIAAFVSAQAGAVVHEIWHSAAGAHELGVDGKTPKKNTLCDFHATLGTVLGALGGDHQLVEPAPLGAIAFAIAHSTPRSSAPLSHSSKDPPSFS
jgi:hypothetical protein